MNGLSINEISESNYSIGYLIFKEFRTSKHFSLVKYESALHSLQQIWISNWFHIWNISITHLTKTECENLIYKLLPLTTS